jgi:1,4-dihydroxy-2-naphthoate octaprenyltransferase
LNEYYDAPLDAANPNRTPFSGGSGTLRDEEQQDRPGVPRELALWLGISCLAIAASLTVLLINTVTPDGAMVAIMFLIFLGAFFYSVPPIRLVSTGYGELTTSILVANLVPAFAFLLQYGEFHRLLGMTTVPLTLLHLAMMIAFDLRITPIDMKFENLPYWLGWAGKRDDSA